MQRFTADQMVLSVRVSDEADNDTRRILPGLRVGLEVDAVGTGVGVVVGVAVALGKISMRA